MTKIHCAHTSTGLPVIKKLPSSFRTHQWIDDEDTFQHPLAVGVTQESNNNWSNSYIPGYASNQWLGVWILLLYLHHPRSAQPNASIKPISAHVDKPFFSVQAPGTWFSFRRRGGNDLWNTSLDVRSNQSRLSRAEGPNSYLASNKIWHQPNQFSFPINGQLCIFGVRFQLQLLATSHPPLSPFA